MKTRLHPLYIVRHGVASIIAMIFLMLFATLATAMFTMSTLNVETASNFSASDRARAAAESGLRWTAWRLMKMNRPKTTVGTIDATVANTLWPALRTAIQNDFATMLNTDPTASKDESKMDYDGTTLSSHPITTGDATAGTFVVSIRQHAADKRYLRVTSTGTYGVARKSVSMDFLIDKKVKFAIVGKVPIQIGRNTLVEGPIATTINGFGKGPPVYMLSDFRHLTTSLKNKIDTFNQFLETYHKGYDNRISVNNPDEYAVAHVAGYEDYNGDAFIDEYDLFVKEFDTNGDKAISKAEFTNLSTNKLYDADLFNAIDTLGAPKFTGDPTRLGYADGIIDNFDAYTKIRGTVSLAVTANDWKANLAGQGLTIQDEIQGPVQPSDGSDLPIVFGANSDDVFDLSPSNFDTSGFKAQTGPSAGTTSKATGTIQNAVLSAADASYCPPGVLISTPGNTTFKAGDIVLKTTFDAANASLPANQKAASTAIPSTIDERSPYGSTAWQATYRRPVFHNMTFKNVQIPKGLNARFENCTFEGVTFVQMTTNITNTSGQTTTNPNDGMTWSQKKVGGGTVKNGSSQGSAEEVLTATNSLGYQLGNNLRFNNCTIHGPIASDVPTAYTHFTNSWEFTGGTLFDNTADQTATMVAPQTNIEMGSFTDPSKAPSTLVGVVVAGNIDIRGSSIVDGSIIVTGDGAGNTTQGWFGPSDASTDPTTPMPEGGYGRLNIRYNPYRPLPNGINVAVDILPDVTTYAEAQ